MAKKRVPHSVDCETVKSNLDGKQDGAIVFAFSRTLDKLLTEKEIDQEQMASDLKMSEGAISNYRNAKTEPKLSAIVKIANYLGVDCHYLMTGIQSKHVGLGDIGLSERAINRILSFKMPEEEIEEFKEDHPDLEVRSVSFISSEMNALNTLFESAAFTHLLLAFRDCLHYSDFPTSTEQLIDVMCKEFPDADKSEAFRKFKSGAIYQAEKGRRDVAIFNVQRAAVMLAEELSQQTEANK